MAEVERLVDEARKVVDGRKDGQAGEESQEFVGFFFGTLAAFFHLSANHSVQLLAVLARVEAFFNGIVDEVGQEVVGNRAEVVVLLKLVELTFQNFH